MTNRQIRVEDAAIEAACDRIETAVDEIGDLLDELERRAARLRSEWTGAASDAYDLAHRDWERQIRVLEKAARDVNVAARTGTSRLRSVDEARARVWAF